MQRGWFLLLIGLVCAAPALSQRNVTLEGSVVTPTPRYPGQTVEVRIEGQASELIALTYTDSSGRFAFRNLAFQGTEIYYIRTVVEGFEPYRERLDRLIDLRSGGHITLMLEPSFLTSRPVGNDLPVVDVSEFVVEIPEAARDLYDRAADESEQGNAEGSIDLLLDALERAPAYAEAHNQLGRRYLELNRVDDARVEFVRASELRPSWVIPLINLGTLEYQQGELHGGAGDAARARESFSAAVETLEHAVRTDPFSAMAHYMLGTALYRTSDMPTAETMLLRSIELNDDLDDARLSLINVYSRQGRIEDALGVVDDYLERNPEGSRSSALKRVRRQLEELLPAR